MLYAVGAHLRYDVGDIRMPVAHAHVDGLAEHLAQHAGLQEGPVGERRAFREAIFAEGGLGFGEANLGVAVLEFFYDFLRHGTPPVTFCRYSDISLSLSGVPWASRRIAVRWLVDSALMYCGPLKFRCWECGRPNGVPDGCLCPLGSRICLTPFDDLNDVVDGCSRDDAMAEVEDVSGAAGGEGEDFRGRGIRGRRAGRRG